MKILFLTSLILVGAFISHPQESPELQEASALTESVAKLFKEEKVVEALPLAKRALEIREKLLRPGDPRILISLNYLGDLYILKQDYKSAKEVFQRLLQIQKAEVGPEHVSLAPTLDRLALLQFRGGNFGAAENAYKQALALREKAFGPVNVQVAHSLVALADLYRARWDFDRAAPIYKRALSIYGQLSGVRTPEFQRASEGFVCLAYENNKRDSVKELDEIWKRFATPDSPREPPQGTVLNGRALSLPALDYPAAARAHRLSGTVVVKVQIDETGRVIGARDMCQGPPYLSEAAVNAARRARFTPTKLSGQPVKVEGLITYHFLFH